MRLSLLILVVLLGGCRKEEAIEPIRPVRVELAKSPEEERTRTFSATAQASEESVLSFKVEGTITSILVNVGDEVEREELLATLDPLDYQLQVEQSEAELGRSKAISRNAQANYDRVRQLYETRTASRSDLDKARAESESAIAQVVAGERALALAERRLDYTYLRAATRGSIAQKLAEVNENVRPNQPIFAMVAGTKPEVKVQIPENLIGQIWRGMPATAKFQALPGQLLKGEVIYIGVATTAAATTYPVTLVIDDPTHSIRSGMTAEITFLFPKGTDAVLVPASAVQGDLEGPYLYLVSDFDGRIGTVERRPVVVGELLGQEIEILSGLDGGERVITAGFDKVTPGTKVSIYKGKPFGELSCLFFEVVE